MSQSHVIQSHDIKKVLEDFRIDNVNSIVIAYWIKYIWFLG